MYIISFENNKESLCCKSPGSIFFSIFQTYNVDRQTPDSAATATALFSGIKTNYYTLGYDSKIKLGSAKSIKNAKKLESIIDWGQAAGKRTGTKENCKYQSANLSSIINIPFLPVMIHYIIIKMRV